MQNNSLIKLLKAFSKKEIQEFREFIISPYFNKKKSVIDLYSILFKYYPEFKNEDLLKENVYKKLFPGKKFNDSNFRVLTHNLNELAKKFCTQKNFENNKPEYKFREFQELMNKHQYQHLEKMISALKQDLDSEKIVADEYYFYKFRLEYENIFTLSLSHSGVFEKFLHKADFEKVFDNLTSYYFIKSMRLYINVLNLQIIYKKEFKTDHFERMLHLIDKETLKENPVIELYHFVLNLLRDNNQNEFYFKTKKKLKQLKNSLHIDDLDEIYINLTNYCNRNIAAGRKEFLKEKFEIYKEESEARSFLLNGLVSPVYYKNRVRLALDLKEFKWAKDFIVNFKNELPADYAKNNYLYCMALYEFETNNFDSSLEFLSGIKFDELYMKFDSKILQMMIYFEMNSEESLISSMETFRHFLINNKLLPENKKESYSNFYKFLNKIIQSVNNKNYGELGRIKLLMSGDLKIMNKEWLMRKTDELLKKKI